LWDDGIIDPVQPRHSCLAFAATLNKPIPRARSSPVPDVARDRIVLIANRGKSPAHHPDRRR